MAGKAPADDTTIRPSKPAVAHPIATAPYLTVLWHPDPARVGEVAPLAPRLSRLEPEFARPGERAGRPLADPHVSRTAAMIGAGRIEAAEIVELVVDGAPVHGAIEVDAAAIDRGVVIELANSVALLLHVRRAPVASPDDGLIGASDAIADLRAEIARVADLDVPVLLAGETGAGKERVARALHDASARAPRPFVAVNMATLSPAMAAAQLFGHARGAFTGAERQHAGLFEQADSGTLFLDEIADASPEVQAMLLRVLETGEVQPIGGEAARRVDVRVIAASDADLAADAAIGEFRSQLYYRLSGYRIAVPPLRTRLDDIGRLLASFVRRELAAAGAEARLVEPWLPTAAIRAFVRHAWPGNVRELANVARHLAIAGRAGPLTVDAALAPLGTQASWVAPRTPEVPRRELTDDDLVAALAANRWKTGATANALGISRTTLYALMERSPRVRKARDLERAEIEACRAATAGDLDAMSEQLRVSKRGLQLRMRELEIA